MTDVTRPSWTLDLAMAAATGAVTTWLPSHRWGRRAQWRLHGGFGALAGAATVFGILTHERRDEGPVPPAMVAGLAGAVALVTTGVSRGGQGADEWLERTLVARGVRRPRVWMGLAAAGASLAASAAERRRSDRPALDVSSPAG